MTRRSVPATPFSPDGLSRAARHGGAWGRGAVLATLLLDWGGCGDSSERDRATVDAASSLERDADAEREVVDGDAAVDENETEAADEPRDAEMDAAVAGDAGAPDAGMPAPACQPFVMPGDCTFEAPGSLPSELRCTGLYGDFAARQIACGVERYKPAFELWSDGTKKDRYVALPKGSHIDVSQPEHFRFPLGTRLWKEFRVVVGGAEKLAETRLLQKTDQGWLYTAYVWSDDQASALQQDDGVPFVHGSPHSVPTRDQCRECHEGRGDFVLGWDPIMLGEGATGMTQARLLGDDLLRVSFDGAIRAPEPAEIQAQVPGDALERDALGYLHTNCGVSCHSDAPLASARETGFYMRLDVDTLLSAATTDTVVTGANRLPGPNAKLPPGGPYYDLLPGDAEHSLLVARMRVRDETQMPGLGTNLVHDEAVALISDFINAMTSARGYPAPADLDAGAPGHADLDAGGDAAAPDAAAPSDVGVGVDADTDASTERCDVSAPPPTQDLAYQIVVRDAALETLSFAAQAPGSDDWYLVEMRGRILRLSRGVLQPTPFLDLTAAISLGAGFDQTTVSYDERGLVGLAFASNYPSSGLFYVTITPSRENAMGLPVNHDLVVEYRRRPGDASAERLRTLIDVPSASGFLGNIHNANTVLFGPDGMLYVGMGDGGGVGCNNAELNAAQDVGKVFGKLLRLDLSLPAPYGATDNPFVNVMGGDSRVLHYGLRNPFRFSFDRKTHDLFLGDVGQDRYEELDVAPHGTKGLNFGWATYEANASCPSASRPQRAGSTHTPPIFVANRRGADTFSDYRAIVGGRVYRGRDLPALEGAYLFGDYYGRRLGALYHCGGQTSSVAVLRKSCDPNFLEPCLKAPSAAPPFASLTAIVEDHRGEVYFVANGNSLLKLIAAP